MILSMIALTGSIRPARYEAAALHLVMQAFRRSYEAVSVEPDELIVRLGGWYVLLTMEPRCLRTDVVVSTRAEAAAFQEEFLVELDRWTFSGALLTTWTRSFHVPVPLR